MDNQPELTMNKCNDPDHGAINAERSESRGLRKAWVELDDKRQFLERELTAARKEIKGLHFALKQSSTIYDVVTEQRDRLLEVVQSRDADRAYHDQQWNVLREQRDKARGALAEIEDKMRVELGGHPNSKLWGEAGLIAATMRCVDALATVTEQRDEWKAKYIQQNKDLGCEQMDPNGTIWDYAKRVQTQLSTVTEQRDAGRREIKQLKEKRCEFCHELPQTENEKAYASEFGDKKGELPTMDEWLQNLTQTEQTK